MRRLFAVLSLVLCALPLAAQTSTPTPIQAERQFVERMADTFSQQDRASEKTPEPVPDAPKDPTPTPPPAAKKPSETEPETESPDDAPVPPTSTPKDDDEATPTDQPAGPDDDEEVIEDDEPTDTAVEVDEEFAAAAKQAKVALTLDDLPEEARPLVKKRIKELEAGFTRAMQDARSYRQDEAKFRSEEAFRTANPAEYVVDLLLSNPALGEQVNVLLDSITTDTAKQAHEIVVRDKRREATEATAAQLKAKDARAVRGLALQSYAETSAMKAGVPMELGVEASVIAHIAEHGDITEQDIDTIVASKAREYSNHTRAIRREASKKYVTGKVKDRASAGLKVKPGSGITPAPSAKPKPKSDAEFADAFVSKMA